MPTACITPPAYGARASGLDDFTGEWWVAQTRPQYERKLACELYEKGIDYFLPTVKETRFYASGKRQMVVLALPMYVFVNGDADARYEAARSHCTNHMIRVANPDRLVKDLRMFEAALTDERVNADNLKALKAGTRCMVKAGHRYAGLEAWIDSKTGRGTAMLAVVMLGETCPIEIEPEALEPVGSSPWFRDLN